MAEETLCDGCGSALNPGHVTRYCGQELCDFCFKTHLGNVIEYHGTYGLKYRTLAKGIAQSFNLLQAQIEELKK